MGSIRFGQSQQNISPAVLNHQTASPLKANNIQIRIGSDYLKDFTPSGIESFVDKHTKLFESGDKKLDAAQVKAFIQKLAQNPESVKNMTFDLKDPELGLLRNDGVEERHIKGAFQVDFEDTSQLAKGSATDVKFVDAKSVTFDLKENEDTIAGAQKQITQLRDEKKGLQGELSDAKDELALARRVIGDGSQEKYEQLHARQGEIKESLASLDKKETDYKAELEAEDTTPERKAELRHVLAGIGEERKALKAEQAQHTETLDKTHGPLLQRYALKDLPALEAKVAAKEKAIGEVDGKIKDQVKVVEGAVNPVADDAKMPDKPTETKAGEAKAEEVKPKAAEQAAADTAAKAEDKAKADTPEPEETIQVGPKPELEALKEKPAKYQAQSLKDMPEADQKTFIASLNADQKAALKTEVESYIASTESTSSARTRTANTHYKALLGVINGESSSTKTSSTSSSTTTSTEKTTTTTKTEAAPGNVTVGDASESVDDGLTRKSQPLKVNGEVVTKSSFKSLSIQDKFDILMKADKEFLRDLLTSMTKEERSEIRTLARARIAKYAGSYDVTSTSTVRIQRNDDGTASYVTTNASGQRTVRAVSKEHQEEVERAQYILDIIAELDGPEAGASSTTTTTTSSTTTTVNRNNQGAQVDTSASTEGLQTVQYRVTPGETASDIANRQYGNRLRGQEILRLNPELEESVKRRANGDEREYTRVPLVDDPKKELLITILHKDEKPLEDPVSHARPATPVQQRPKVVEEKPADKPVEKPAEKPAPVATEKPVVTPKPETERPKVVEEKPAPPPRKTS